MSYDFAKVEKKWQDKWYAEGTFNAKNDYSKEKWYGLIEFPYPSGQGLHVGHPRSYTALDIIARKRRMQGYNVLFPIGFDAFGLPAENYAIKNHVHPKITTEKNINHFREQLKSIGFSFDWSREVNTTDPNYYKWTQWIFIQLYKHGLAYKATMPINFCTGCKVGLANEEVVNGVCERCGSPVVQKEKSQWMLKITEYAQRLIDDLDEVDFLDKIKAQQKNWIGRSEGAEVTFKIANHNQELVVYTTRPDTLFGATYMVVAPEHPMIKELSDNITNLEEVKEYQRQASLKSDFERSELNKEKTGVEIKGLKAINPLTGNEIPIWVSDYVLITYGTGAIMAVPAHDTRDWEFAKNFNLPIIPVIESVVPNVVCDVQKEAFTDVATGKLINSGFLNGLSVKEAINTVINYLEEKGIGFDTGITKVPLVCASSIFDLGLGDKNVRPDFSMGYRACVNAEAGNYQNGSFGAGCGATVGKFLGPEFALKSGIGSFAVQLGTLKVGAIVCVNALGDIYQGGKIVAGLLSEDKKGFRSTCDEMLKSIQRVDNPFVGNTTIGVVVTNGKFSKSEMNKIAQMAHNGLVRCISPVNTSADGDSIYAMSVGDVNADVNVTGTIAAEVVEQAIINAVMSAAPGGGLPCAKDICA